MTGTFRVRCLHDGSDYVATFFTSEVDRVSQQFLNLQKSYHTTYIHGWILSHRARIPITSPQAETIPTGQGSQIFLDTKTKTGKIYQMTTRNTN
jgi:hypothetical protein